MQPPDDLIASGWTSTSAVELAAASNLPVIGTIDRFETMDDPAFGDAIERLRIAAALTSHAAADNVIQLTSTRSGEGKSTIALALCASVSRAGLSVLLIDTSIRNPKLSQSLGVTEGPSLNDVLKGSMTAAGAIRECARFDGALLPAVAGGGSAIDILASERFGPTIQSLKSSFDYIVVDSPPSDLTIDPFIVAEHSDRLIYVVRYGRVQPKAVRYSIRQLSRYKSIDGLVFNGVE